MVRAGRVGIVRPSNARADYEETRADAAKGVPLIPLCLDVRRGALDEFKSAAS
jgi:hypothetical protein